MVELRSMQYTTATRTSCIVSYSSKSSTSICRGSFRLPPFFTVRWIVFIKDFGTFSNLISSPSSYFLVVSNTIDPDPRFCDSCVPYSPDLSAFITSLSILLPIALKPLALSHFGESFRYPFCIRYAINAMPESSRPSSLESSSDPVVWCCSLFSCCFEREDITPRRVCSSSCKLGVFSFSASLPIVLNRRSSRSLESSRSSWLSCPWSWPSLLSGKYTNFLLPRARLCEIIGVVILFIQEWRLGVPEALKYYLSHRCRKLTVEVLAQRYIVCFYSKLQRLLGKLFLLFFYSSNCFVYHLLE